MINVLEANVDDLCSGGVFSLVKNVIKNKDSAVHIDIAAIEEFEKKEKERRKNFNSYYNKNNKYNKFYWTQKWKQLREYVLARDDYLCQDCLNNKVITEATEVHHIEKIRKAWDKRYDPDNCIALCSECHRIRDRNC